MKIAGLVLFALGLIGLIYGGFRYTSRDTIVDIGPIHATADREHSVPVAPIAGAIMVAAGAVLLVRSRRTV